LKGIPHETYLQEYAQPAGGLYTNLWAFATHPWGLFSHMFVHFDALHVLFNMIFLYFAGKMFEQFFDQKRLLYTYLLGGIFGGVLEILAHFLFAKTELSGSVVVGASGSIMAIFMAIAFYRPNITVQLFGIIPVRMIIIAGIFLLMDLFKLNSGDGTAHFAHLGGAILGMISVQRIHSSGNLITLAQRFGSFVRGLFSRNKKVRMKAQRTSNTGSRPKTDEDYIIESKQRQDQINRILDKISKSGYESLSKAEKDFLFNQSKNK
ncbi:MAG: hypothetical protein A3D92_06400, partial [Bacteroidetes bacterium RIFCSPHIGHO2_02_FULL_44_7]